MRRSKLFIFGLLISGLAVMLLYGGVALAQYPTQPVTVIVPVAAGGSLDVFARFLCNLAEKSLGKPLVIENRIGAAHTVGSAVLAKAKPDGYTLGFIPFHVLALNPHQIKGALTYEHFTPIVAAYNSTQGLCVQAGAPWNTLKEFVEYVRKNPGVVFGHPGRGGAAQLTTSYLAKKENIKLDDLPFAGGAPANTALLGGHVKAVAGAGSHMVYVKQGKFKLLVVYGTERLKSVPNVPTLSELGYADFSINLNHGFFAPKGIREDVRKILEKAFTEAIKTKAFADFAEKVDMTVDYHNGADSEKILEKEYVQWSVLLKALEADVK